MFGVLDGFLDAHHIEVVIEGEAPGADTLGRIWAELHGIPVEQFPADWTRYGREAGPKRNKQMLDEGKPDFVVGFIDKPKAESRGTNNMISQAGKRDVPYEWYSRNKEFLL